MSKVLLENVSADLVVIVGIISSVAFLHKSLREWLFKLLKDKFDRLDKKVNDSFSRLDTKVDDFSENVDTKIQVLTDNFDRRIDDLSESIENVDRNSCRNFIVTFLSSVENDEPVGETETIRFWKLYKRYKDFGGNGYIAAKVEKLQSEGKL